MPINILIAEDEKDIAEQYQMGFEERGHNVRLTYNGIECINEYRRARQTLGTKNPLIYDVVIVDHNMPLKDGAKLAEEIREINPDQIMERVKYLKIDNSKKWINVSSKTGENILQLKDLISKMLELKKPLASKKSRKEELDKIYGF